MDTTSTSKYKEYFTNFYNFNNLKKSDIINNVKTSSASIDDFIICEDLHIGRATKIYKAYLKVDESFLCCVKKLKRKRYTEKYFDLVCNEVNNLNKLRNHNNIINIYDFFYDKDYFYIITEYSKIGDLFNYMDENGKFEEEKAKKIIYQVAEAINICHKNNIIHRDIKTENILVFPNNIKLIDFGWSEKCKDNEYKDLSCGTRLYFSPEIVSGKVYSKKIDVWCLGILFYELLSLKTPFDNNDNDEILLNIKYINYDYFNDKDYFSEESKEFISSLLTYEDKRPSISDVLNNKYFH